MVALTKILRLISFCLITFRMAQIKLLPMLSRMALRRLFNHDLKARNSSIKICILTICTTLGQVDRLQARCDEGSRLRVQRVRVHIGHEPQEA